jgi:trimeric autotransporter adhesin
MKKSHIAKAFTSLAWFTLVPDLALALPQDPQVIAGEAKIDTKNSKTMIVETSDKAIVNYKSFDIAKKEKVKFVQPSSSSCVLNRVNGGETSKILGTLEGNGKVFLVNPQGIYFGKDAVVNVGSFIASTLDIADQDFLNEKYEFNLPKGMKGSEIVNEGKISSSAEGSIVLMAPVIRNHGVIEAKAGRVLLASGEKVTLDFSGDGLMQFAVEGEIEEAVIEHLGKISSDTGDVVLRLKVAEKAIKSIVNQDGVEEGEVFVEENGIIKLVSASSIEAKNVTVEGKNVTIDGDIKASDKIHIQGDMGLPENIVTITGELDISSKNGGGGSVHIFGENIQLNGTLIDASGKNGGGEVLIGGDYKGLGPDPKASTVVMDQNSTILADAVHRGNGGLVVLWSENVTLFNGSISAQGGKWGGDGGLIETSAKTGTYTGSVNTLAPKGKVGSWLLDPTTIAIDGGVDALPTDCSTPAGTVSISAATINAAASDVLLCASTSITQSAGQAISMTNDGVGITFQGSPGSITTTLRDNITTRGGAVTFTNTSIDLTGSITIDTTNGGGTAAGAHITIGAVNANVTTTSAEGLTLRAGTAGNINLTSAGETKPLGLFTVTEANQVTIGGNITTKGNATAGGSINISAPLVLGASATLTTTGGGATAGSHITLTTANASVATASAEGLTLHAGTGGNISLTSAGATNPLGLFTVSGANQITVNGNVTTRGNATAGGTIAISAPLVLGASSTITTTGGGATAGNHITLTTANANTATTNAEGLTLHAGTGGDISLTSAGGTNPLGLFTVSGANQVTVNGNVTTRGDATVGGAIAIGAPLVLGASATLATTGGGATAGDNITLTTVNANTATTSAEGLTLNAGTGGNIGLTHT